MAYRSLLQYLREAVVQWQEQREVYFALGQMLDGSHRQLAPPTVKLMEMLMLETFTGAYDTIKFSCGLEESLVPTLSFAKDNEPVAADIPPAHLISSLMECFELLAERSGTTKEERTDAVCRQRSEFPLTLGTKKMDVVITKGQSTIEATVEASRRLERFLIGLEDSKSKDGEMANPEDMRDTFSSYLLIQVSVVRGNSSEPNRVPNSAND